MIAELQAFGQEGREHRQAVIAELKDVRDESRAQREALLMLIDRLPPPSEDPSNN